MFTRPIRRLIRSAQELLRLLVSIPQRIASAIATWFIRRAVRAKRGYRRSPNWANAGFVLPTAVLLTLVVALTVGALTFRTFSRTSDVVTERQQRVIQNAATPAIDRAKAKIEQLFSNDVRFPGGVPASDVLVSMMANDGQNGIPALDGDPYTFNDETIVGDATDLTWQFTDEQGNTVTYSILVDDENGGVTISSSDTEKAANNVVRNGPISMEELGRRCARADFSRDPEGGWYPVDTANVRRVFQVDAYVKDPNNNRVAALEFQQDRQASRGNKWGAWFRTDLEVFPGPNFMWNGAMHSEGSIIAKDRINAHLVSSPNSCVYSKEASEITTAEYVNDPGNPDFQGQFINGVIGQDTFGNDNGTAKFHLFDPTTPDTGNKSQLKPGTDSIVQSTNGLISQIALNEFDLFTKNESVSRAEMGSSWDYDEANWKGKDLNANRLINSKTPIPFLDDTFRADNRYGPKPEYKDQNPDSFNLIAMGEEIGNPITSRSDLTGNTGGDTAEFGLDGYWERRATATGIRTIVGERLELGNAFGWQGADLDRNNDKIPDADLDGDGVIDATYNGGFLPEPLYPSPNLLDGLDGSDDYSDDDNTDVIAQNRTLWDNLAAVQAMAVYRYDHEDGAVPLACVASTSHPATKRTIENSKIFNTAKFDSNGDFAPDTDVDFDTTQAGVQTAYNIDFLRGVGTNGWEFDFPYTDAGFSSAYSSGPLRRALENLAHFAGDPEGGAPSFTPVQDSEVHPYPYMKMWGDFSMLRRILDEGTSYSSLSIADKSTLHTATCTLGMLAYTLELDRAANLDNDDLTFFTSQELSSMVSIGNRIESLFDGNESNGEIYANGSNTKQPRVRINQARGITNDFDNNGDGNVNGSDVAQPAYLANPAAIRTPTQWAAEGQDTVDNSGLVAGCATDNLTTYDRACDAGDYYQTLGRKTVDGAPIYLTPEEVRLAAIADAGGGGGITTQITNDFNRLATFQVKLQRIQTANQVLRDRTYGFKATFPEYPDGDGTDAVYWNPETGRVQTTSGTQYVTACDPDIFHEAFSGGGGGLDSKAVGLALAFCSQQDKIVIPPPKYPALYYLFPVTDHDLAGGVDTFTVVTASGNVSVDVDHTQPAMEEYVADPYVSDADTIDGYTYQVVDPDDVYGAGTDRAGSFASIMIEPRARSDWDLPSSTTVTNAPNVILDNGTSVAVAFMDHNFYDGRELMNTRLLAYDLDLLTDDGEGDFIRDDEDVNELGSIIYAFREDAVREDEIVRPTADDPDITESANKISRKAVDFEAEPDRRPHGFMLERGADLKRDNLAGMTFVSDNSVYIKGDFNLHSTDGTRNAIIEEFDEKMENVNLNNAGNYSNTFYGREDLNENFADPDEDHWRPVEVLGDAVGFFSNVFDNDFNGQGRGSIEDAFNSSLANRSYMAMRRPDLVAVPTANWYRERPGGRTIAMIGSKKSDPILRYFDKDDEAANGAFTYVDNDVDENIASQDINLLPIMFNRNGYPLYCGGGFAANGTCAAELTAYGDGDGNEFRSVTDNTRLDDLVDLASSDEIFVNATVVTGVVPSRSGQSYGGLHNLPHLAENWDNVDLNFAGAFFQLNFSTYATAPWDADPDTSNASFNFYGAPNRRWGYDVGLLYAPAAPVARRFVTLSSNRSEFYRELPSDDPYITRLQ
ncbi:MAG: hormogonium polysaccharide biosynthesis protein HpsA [Thainema sp.]